VILFYLGILTLINVLKYDSSTQASTYIDTLFASGFLQIITKPTRCTAHSATLIDHAITNSIQSVYDSAILTKRISDHFHIVAFSNIGSVNSKKDFITFRDFPTTILTISKLHFLLMTGRVLLQIIILNHPMKIFVKSFLIFIILFSNQKLLNLIKNITNKRGG
jgi:hypothetical protein